MPCSISVSGAGSLAIDSDVGCGKTGAIRDGRLDAEACTKSGATRDARFDAEADLARLTIVIPASAGAGAKT